MTTDRSRNVDRALPLLYARSHAAGHQALRTANNDVTEDPRKNHPETELTRGAREALRRSGLSRRLFLKESGALIVCFSACELGLALFPPSRRLRRRVLPPEYGPINSIRDRDRGRWRRDRIRREGGTRAGDRTAQAQLVAEELCVPFERVKLIIAIRRLLRIRAYTSGSQSHPANFNHRIWRRPAATAREALLRLAPRSLASGRATGRGGRRHLR